MKKLLATIMALGFVGCASTYFGNKVVSDYTTYPEGLTCAKVEKYDRNVTCVCMINHSTGVQVYIDSPMHWCEKLKNK